MFYNVYRFDSQRLISKVWTVSENSKSDMVRYGTVQKIFSIGMLTIIVNLCKKFHLSRRYVLCIYTYEYIYICICIYVS